MTRSILEVRGLEKRFESVYAARDVWASFGNGEIVGIIGANGAGKTTFVNLVTGYLLPSAGSVYFEDREVTGLSPREIKELGLTRSFQVPQLFDSISLLDNLLLALGLSGQNRRGVLAELRNDERVQRCQDLTRSYGIEEYKNRIAGSAPQGVRKLLDIAMATVAHPKVLFLDEPTSGVSRDERDELMETVINNARTQGTTLLIIEHDMEVIQRFVDRVVAFYEGGIICDAATVEALEHEAVRRFVLGVAEQDSTRDDRQAHA